MAVRPIRLLGDPVLRSHCELIENAQSPAVRVIADDLQETFHDLRSRHGVGRGLSAPQIGAPVRIAYVEHEGPLFLINPEITDPGTDDFAVWDDCFSVPHLVVRVLRAYRIAVRYQDMQGRDQALTAEGEFAELLQHEIDHLDGVLIVDRAFGLDPFCLREEWNKHYAHAGQYGQPEPRFVAKDYINLPTVPTNDLT